MRIFKKYYHLNAGTEKRNRSDAGKKEKAGTMTWKNLPVTG
jgi:hypothetical protein